MTPNELANWARVRRYAVPAWMIEQATERRLAGDWRGACAAARVDVAFDLADVAREHGRQAADELEEVLLHFAPDLLRWHLPRTDGGRATLITHHVVKLRESGYGALHVTLPMMVEGPQRLTLHHAPKLVRRSPGGRRKLGVLDWTGAPGTWDVRHADDLRHGAERMPFFHPDGTPLRPDELPAARPEGGPGLAEWAALLYEREDLAGAFAAVGIEADLTMPEIPYYWDGRRDPVGLFGGSPVDFTLLGGQNGALPLLAHTGLLLEDGTARLVPLAYGSRLHVLHDHQWRFPPDLELVRAGKITPEELHPLVRSAMFPKRPEPDGPVGPPGPEPLSPVRVRCRGDWHEVRFTGGAFVTPHTAEEEQREQALKAFGGQISGCFAVRETLAGAEGRLPKRLRAQYLELFVRAQHGDTPAVLQLLDAGMDPRLRDGRKRTLLHYLHMLDHEVLLPRLLAAGLDVNAADHNERTPLHMAVGDYGSVALVRALIDAGARTDTVDGYQFSLANLIRQHKRTELDWLRDRVEAEFPDIGSDYWDEFEDYGEDDEEDDE
ncbi:ankyrin repeat domain-containing protein [Actinomadura macrotermitis]|uniref:Ankyrin repeat domain-containing protein n=1 Tax=Actinomadura macrotermitis TaxID=2585200 RepID=A0A7K0C970_9ACTN|nr:ankyrin repeat domain-containing protein [Actinomadura macrotermitis]MQY09334.1 hypothetical protein [Actinomadura macrotermitis]